MNTIKLIFRLTHNPYNLATLEQWSAGETGLISTLFWFQGYRKKNVWTHGHGNPESTQVEVVDIIGLS